MTDNPSESSADGCAAFDYGMFVPFFFVLSGVTFDLGALLGSATSMLLVPLFLGLFLVVRGGPAWQYARMRAPETARSFKR